MKLHCEPKPVLAVCLNPAWQKILTFKKIHYGEVNRAMALSTCGGGKGVNVARVFRLLGLPVAVAAFVGGHNGRCLMKEFLDSGVQPLTVEFEGETRCCCTLISQEDNAATELIEPSATIPPTVVQALLDKIIAAMDSFGAVTLSGTVSPGVPPDFYAQVARCARAAGVPVVLDAVKSIAPTLTEGVHVLKINAAELRELTGLDNMRAGGDKLLATYEHLHCVAVTDGPRPAGLFTRGMAKRIILPPLTSLVSAIGGGDCATAIMARRLAEEPNSQNLPQFFAEALACASASCLTATPSVFEPTLAQELMNKAIIEDL
jgi:tagatose 6-phosphate kinase